MHLGRTPSRLPPDLFASELGPAAAWRRAVDTAIDRGVQAVLLAGDLVDREDDFFEAYRGLEAGVRRLTEAGIEVIGVAGNHDVRVLPRLAGHIPQFRLLGAGGTWESVSVCDGTDAVAVWGWSFPSSGTAPNPLQDWTFNLAAGINLGLLHCDRDAGADSRYAPVASRDLQGARLDGWLLGHIHKPDPLSAESPSGYLGSLTGLDRGEPGPRGPWLITVAGGRITGVEHLPLAPLRWEALDVSLDKIGEPADAKDRLLETVRALAAELAALPAPPAPRRVCPSGSPAAPVSEAPPLTRSLRGTGTISTPDQPGRAISSTVRSPPHGPKSTLRNWPGGRTRSGCWRRVCCCSTAQAGTLNVNGCSAARACACGSRPTSPSGTAWKLPAAMHSTRRRGC